jgi:predicted DNA-binding transcriptional regulator AlpA
LGDTAIAHEILTRSEGTMSPTAILVQTATFSIRQVSTFTGRSMASLYRDIAANRFLPGFTIGRRRYWLRSEVEEFLAAGCPPLTEWNARRKVGRPDRHPAA